MRRLAVSLPWCMPCHDQQPIHQRNRGRERGKGRGEGRALALPPPCPLACPAMRCPAMRCPRPCRPSSPCPAFPCLPSPVAHWPPSPMASHCPPGRRRRPRPGARPHPYTPLRLIFVDDEGETDCAPNFARSQQIYFSSAENRLQQAPREISAVPGAGFLSIIEGF